MFVTGVPQGLRVTQLSTADTPAVTALVQNMEREYFGRSETNDTEIRGVLSSPELRGARNTAGLWEDDRLVGALLAFDGLEHGRGLHMDLFADPGFARREDVAACLLGGGEAFAHTLPSSRSDYIKCESFAGDHAVTGTLAARDYEPHRTYLRMRLDFHEVPRTGELPAGLTDRRMTEGDWEALHTVITTAFRDHYDSHPLPLELFRQDSVNDTTDFDRWRLVFDGDDCVGVCIASKRYAAHGLGYVENLAVLRQYRGRGIARYLLRDAFSRDHAAGFTGTSLHCDATNPTGATHLYESVGMSRDQEYQAWRTPLPAGVRASNRPQSGS
jgi:ribosomal protein S18 acetylase RimI-like enzyme